MKIGLLLAGYKAGLLLEHLRLYKNIEIEFISSYDDPATLDDTYIKIKRFCVENKVKFISRFCEYNSICQNVEKVFVVGWQYMLKDCLDKFVILHDSYLPQLKGWCPTVTSLLCGDERLGVTAFQPTDEVDSGPVYMQRQIEITYPIKIKEAFKLLARLYADMIRDIIEKDLRPEKQSIGRRTSYSIWRDRWDMYIDWNMSADYIQRFVNALGFPYSGAKTPLYDGDKLVSELVINDVEIVEPHLFAIRQPGKIWGLKDGRPLVVCGHHCVDFHMIEITSATNVDGSPVEFKKIKQRLFNPKL